MVALAGRVLVPGPGGLPADHGQVPLAGVTVDLFLCQLRKLCQATGEPVAHTVTDPNGRFSIVASAALVQGTLPVVLARISATFVLRAPVLAIPISSARAFPRQARDATETVVDSISEAAVQLLDEQGFEYFTLDGIAAIVEAVQSANATANFQNQTPEQAVDMAKSTAASDPALQTALVDNHSCVGDCNGKEGVTVNEIIQCVAIALESIEVDTCAQCDGDRNGKVTITEVVTAVDNALSGCGLPTPTPTITPTPT